MSIYSSFLKHLLDFVFALMLSLLVIPLVFLLCFLVLCDGQGSPLFFQRRVGKGGKPFFLFKIRSMRKNAFQKGPFYTKKEDPRITPLGEILRKWSLDELPQVWNVLLGHMSFIGPRPDQELQKKFYTSQQWEKRHQVRPGITGLAQALLRSSGTMEERILLDLKYVEEYGFVLDCKIVWKTFLVVLKRKGVN